MECSFCGARNSFMGFSASIKYLPLKLVYPLPQLTFFYLCEILHFHTRNEEFKVEISSKLNFMQKKKKKN